MKVAIMQPYFLPYIGYFQLIYSVDVFVVYDNIQYTKKGWINRNRYLRNGTDAIFSIPLKKDSDYLYVNERKVSDTFNKIKLLNQMNQAYRNAPYFDQTFSLFENVVLKNEYNLFDYIHFSINETCKYLDINTKIVKSSEIIIDHNLKSQDKVIEICKYLEADIYINAIGGQDLYSKEKFKKNEIELRFIKSKPIKYNQFNNDFVPWLTIIDCLMFKSKEAVKKMLSAYEFL